MKQAKEGSIATILIIIVLMVIALGIFMYLPAILQKTEESSEGPTKSEVTTYQKGDINQDGKVDSLDEILIKNNSNCRAGESCWEKVIEHTVSGYNPIYVKDLDLNKDGVVDNNDLNELHK